MAGQLSFQFEFFGEPTQEDLKILRYKYHTHKCDCGHCWKHCALKQGNTKAHTCVKCGKEVWAKYKRGEKFVLSCPKGGVPDVLPRSSGQDQPGSSEQELQARRDVRDEYREATKSAFRLF